MWNTNDAIERKWVAGGLDATFTATWPAGYADDYSALNDDEARPDTPTPYCVVYTGPDVRAEGDSGRPAEADRKQSERRQITIQFDVVADSKTQARTLAEAIADVFEPSGLDYAENCGDRFVRLWREFDAPKRGSGQVWTWILSYIVEVDADIPRAP